jgi:hypothetical protein
MIFINIYVADHTKALNTNVQKIMYNLENFDIFPQFSVDISSKPPYS